MKLYVLLSNPQGNTYGNYTGKIYMEIYRTCMENIQGNFVYLNLFRQQDYVSRLHVRKPSGSQFLKLLLPRWKHHQRVQGWMISQSKVPRIFSRSMDTELTL